MEEEMIIQMNLNTSILPFAGSKLYFPHQPRILPPFGGKRIPTRPGDIACKRIRHESSDMSRHMRSLEYYTEK